MAVVVTLEEAKAHLRVDTTDDDALITGLIAAATELAEQWLSRSLTDGTATPQPIKVGINLLVAHWYINTEATTAGTMTLLPLGVQELLRSLSGGDGLMAENAGQLRETVAFDERVLIDDEYGNTEGTFLEAFQCRAGFTFLRGGEAVMASRLEGRQPVVARVRESSQTRQIEPDWRMRDIRTGASYAVRSVAATPDRQWIDVTAEGGVAQ